MRLVTRWPVLGAVLIALAAGEARALPPPIHEASNVVRDLLEGAKGTDGGIKRCTARADAAGRSGTVWVDVKVPDPHRAGPTFSLRSSPGLIAADLSCVRAVVAKQVLPDMRNIAYQPDNDGEVDTVEVALGTRARYLPPLASFLPAWRALTRAPADAAARARVARAVRPLATVGTDGCLLVHREERLQPAREHWLMTVGRGAPRVWKPLMERLAKPKHVSDPNLFAVDGALLLFAQRVGGASRSPRVPEDWSRTFETYCLLPLDNRLQAEVDRGIDEIASCVVGKGVDRLVDPRLESPPGRKLHSLSLSDWRYCGIDQDGAIVCCGVRQAPPPAGTFSAVSVIENYGCAIRSNGELACWGEAPLRESPPAGRFTKLHVLSGACAIDAAKNVHCWGIPTAWQQIPKGEFVDVALGRAAINAVGADGTLVTWGAKSERRAVGAARVVANYMQSCVITRTGTVQCEDATGLKADLAGPFVGFAPGHLGGCGVAADGALACDHARPFDGAPAPAADRYLEIASTSDRMCATTRAGRVVCWGDSWPGGLLGMRPVIGAVRE